MDSIDRQILAAKSPLEVQDPGHDYMERIAKILETIHGNKECDGENCKITDILSGHAYLNLRIRQKLPHLFAVLVAKKLVTDIENNTVPPDFADVAEKIRAAKDLELPQNMVN